MKDKDDLQEIHTALRVTQRRQNQGPEGESIDSMLYFVPHEETTASQALHTTSPAILASFKQTKTDMQPLLAKVPNPNIDSGSYSIHELITATSLWLPMLTVCKFTSAMISQALSEAIRQMAPGTLKTLLLKQE